MVKKKTAVHIFHSSGKPIETRLYKTCKSITALNIVDEAVALCYHEEDLLLVENITDEFSIVRINCYKNYLRSLNRSYFRIFIGLLSLFKYLFSAMVFCIKTKPYSVSCHNAQLLPFCCLVKFFTGAKLIYEPHELESHKTGLSENGKKITNFIETKSIPYCDKIVCVCEPISEFYVKEFNINKSKVHTVANAPINPNFNQPFVKKNMFRKIFGISNEDIIFLYQGLISEGRGLDVYLKTFEKLPKNLHMIFMGYGDGLEKVLKYCAIHSNIHYQKAVPQNEIINYSSSADVGLFFLTGTISLSYRYSLPNKFYEYAIAGLKIGVSDNLELLAKYVENYQLGDVIPVAENSLFDYIMKYKDNLEHFRNIHPTSLEKRMSFGWQNEEKIFVEIYNSLNV